MVVNVHHLPPHDVNGVEREAEKLAPGPVADPHPIHIEAS
jgi:hypothetical protein